MVADALNKPSVVAAAMATRPIQKIAEPSDITGTIAYLASSNLSGHITGEVITMYGCFKYHLTKVREEWKDDF